MPAVRKVSELRRRWQRRRRMTRAAGPYPTIDQFRRAYQTKERPVDLVAPEIQKITK